MKLFTEFQASTTEDWRKAVDKELKGLAFEDTIQSFDKIEEISFSKFDDKIEISNSNFENRRGSKNLNNDWFIGKTIEVKDEKIANQEALLALNQGANSITFHLQKKAIHWESLFREIGLNYIEIQFKTIDDEQSQDLNSIFPTFCEKPLVILNDWLQNREATPKKSSVQFAVNGFGIHQVGANATQEIAFALAAGHDCLHQLMNQGFSIDEASKMVRFELGIGSNYFIEASKFRVFRKLWATIVGAYEPQKESSHRCFIYAKTGFVNKSLADPYTNLLRQTTEAMSAILGGANEIQVQAYDKFAIGANRGLSERMALNISNILKEESYFDKVADPLGGSYSLENLATNLENKAWGMFQKMESLGGISDEKAGDWLRTDITKTVENRKNAILNKEQILIGINKFPNPENISFEWMELPSYFNLPALILEKI